MPEAFTPLDLLKSSLLVVTLTAISPLVAAVELPFRSHAQQGQSKLGLYDVSSFLRSDILGVARKAVGTDTDNVEAFFQEETTAFHAKAKDHERRHLASTLPNADSDLPIAPLPHAKAHNFPYITCDFDEDVLGLDAYSKMVEHFSDSALEEIDSGVSRTMNPLYNADDATCFIVQTTASLAESAPSHLGMQPILPGMKFADEFVSKFYDGHFADTETVRLYLCPGIGAEVQENDELAELLLKDEIFNNLDEDCHEHLNDLSVRAGEGEPYLFVEGAQNMMSNDALCGLEILLALAESHAVCSVEPLVQPQLYNKEARWITQTGYCKTGRGYACSATTSKPSTSDDLNSQLSTPFYYNGIFGAGQVVQVSDTGLDLTHDYFKDATCGLYADKTARVISSCRKVVQYYAHADTSDDDGGHGTHVCGSVAGRLSFNGVSNNEVGSQGELNENGLGMDAKLAFFDIGVTGVRGLNVPNPLTSVFSKGYTAGARIHSASWGSSSNSYGGNDIDIDKYMYSNDDFLVIVAAGNSGDTKTDANGNALPSNEWKFNVAGTVGTPATAKNIISVGATQSGPSDINSGSNPNKGFQYLASFSSRGPTYDGRTKPDVVAPGFFINSATANNARSDAHTHMAGTSMATPVVSGTATLVRDYFVQGFYPTGSKVPANSMLPSAALVKAVIINGAVPLLYSQNDDNSGSIYNIKEYDANANFGRVQLNNALSLTNNNDIKTFVSDGSSLTQTKAEVFEFVVDKSGCSATDFAMTLTWTDPSTSSLYGCTNCVLNDLDLKVEKLSSGGSTTGTYYPNGGYSRDTKNNAERVRLTNIPDGQKIRATVTARSLSYGTKQKFAFVASGCIGQEAEATVKTTAAPTKPVTPAPTRTPITPNPTRAGTSSPTTASFTEILVKSDLVMRGCGKYEVTPNDILALRKALDEQLTLIADFSHVCDMKVDWATSSFGEILPPAPIEGEGRKLFDEDAAIRIEFTVTVNVEQAYQVNPVKYANKQMIFEELKRLLSIVVTDPASYLQRWLRITAPRVASGLCFNQGLISQDPNDHTSPTTYTEVDTSLVGGNRYCDNWTWSPPASKSPTSSPTDSPTMSPTNSPTNSPTKRDATPRPTASPTKAPVTKSPTASPTVRTTNSPTKAQTSAPTSGTCKNGVKDGSETDKDCGGNCKPAEWDPSNDGRCALGQGCADDWDCMQPSLTCSRWGKCAVPWLTNNPTSSPTKAPLVPTSSPTVSPTNNPTAQATWKLTILQFTFIFRIDGVKVVGFGDVNVETFLKALMDLLGGKHRMRSIDVVKKQRQRTLEDAADDYDSWNDDALGEWPPPSKVAAVCGAGTEEMVINMYDTYSDGWDGATGTIRDSSGNLLSNDSGNDFTLVTGGSGSVSACATIGKCYYVSLTSGKYASEVSWDVTNSKGVKVLERAAGSGAPVTNAEFCVTALVPTSAPSPAATAVPFTEITMNAVMQLDEVTSEEDQLILFNEMNAALKGFVDDGTLDKKLRARSDWGDNWSAKLVFVDTDFVDAVDIVDTKPEPWSEEGEGFIAKIKGVFKKFGIFIAAGAGCLVVLIIVIVLVVKLKGRSSGSDRRKMQQSNVYSNPRNSNSSRNSYQPSPAKSYGKPAKALPPPRKASRNMAGVNLAAAAGKGVSYGKNMELV